MTGWLPRGFKQGVGCLMALLPALAMAGEPAMKTRTASAEFDRLFTLAQTELEQDKVDAITDWSFNDQKPFPCVCFETGEKWHYVWTRDLSYAADLALARLDPERTKTSLRFKLGKVRTLGIPAGTMVAQDTGSGGSWPVSTDRVVWFLAARHLLDDAAFRREATDALRATLPLDRQFAFDPDMGLYRGETSFLDWREQNYPAWTAKDTTFIAESFALSTNVLHYQALRLAEILIPEDAGLYRKKAEALRVAIDRRFWNEDRGMYMSWIGTAFHPVPVESYDLLGTALVITSGIAPPERARRALSNYPVAELGSPVIWPQQPGTPIYHNRAMWPFVSGYALRAARKTQDVERIAFEIRSLMRGAGKAGSNMENFELTTQAVHFEDGALSGPVVNSPRQLWSVAAYLDMVMRGVFGLEDDGTVNPMLPTRLVPELFGDHDTIVLALRDRRILLRKPKVLGTGAMLVAGSRRTDGNDTIVSLVPQNVSVRPLQRIGAQFAPPQPEAPKPERVEDAWRIRVAPQTALFADGKRVDRFDAARDVFVPASGVSHCFSLTNVGADGIESLPSRTTCVGPAETFSGPWPRVWHAPKSGRYRAFVRYRNANGPINTGITAAVQSLMIQCTPWRSHGAQFGTIVMPHNETETDSTSWIFEVHAGCDLEMSLRPQMNMSGLDHFQHYTGGKGGASGPLNTADIGTLTIMPITAVPLP